jgi:hypothetical protein
MIFASGVLAPNNNAAANPNHAPDLRTVEFYTKPGDFGTGRRIQCEFRVPSQ